MLVISRKTGEEIQIGDNIRISVLNIERGVVRLGIQAPKDINITRTEIMKEPDADEASATEENQ